MISQNRGFTLMEMMVVVAIIGILAGVAYASYSEYVTKTRRSDAKIAIELAATAQEKWYFQRGGYTDNVDEIGGDAGVLNSPEGFYTITIDNLVGVGNCVGGGAVRFNCFQIIATPVVGGVQENDDSCQAMLVDHTGLRASTDVNGNPSTAVCW